AHAQSRDRARVHHPDSRDAPYVGNVAVAGQHEIDLELAQDRHHVSRVPEVVDVTAGAGDGQDVVMDDDDPGSVGPATERRVEPAVMLAPDLAFIDVGLGRVDGDHPGMTVG